MNLKGLLGVVAMLGGVLAAVPALPAAPATAVAFRTSDGVQIAGTLYQPSKRPAPYVILVHMLARSRDDWQGLATRLADAGIGVLAIDLRGHGASAPDPRPDASAADDLSPDLLDVEAARAFLGSRTDLGVSRVGIGGAQIGANLAVMAAAADPSIHALVLLSPGLEYRGLRIEAPLRKCTERPTLIVVSLEDSYPVWSVRRLDKALPGSRDVRFLSGAGHGTAMLARQPDLIAAIVEWFQRML